MATTEPAISRNHSTRAATRQTLASIGSSAPTRTARRRSPVQWAITRRVPVSQTDAVARLCSLIAVSLQVAVTLKTSFFLQLPYDRIFVEGYYMYAKGNAVGKTATLTSPTLGYSQDMNVCFFYHMYGSGVGKLTLRVMESGKTPVELWSKGGNQGNEWRKACVSVLARAGRYTVILYFIATMTASAT